MQPRFVVIDGSNAASAEKTPDGRPKLHNIMALETYFRDRGLATEVFVDATLKSVIDRPDELERRIRNQSFRQSPGRGVEADKFILETALQEGGLVVSNDRFRGFVEQFPTLFAPSARYFLRFLIVRGQVQLANEALAILGDPVARARQRSDALPGPQNSSQLDVCGECGGHTPATGMLRSRGLSAPATSHEFADACANLYGLPLCIEHLIQRRMLPRCVDLGPPDSNPLDNPDLVWAVLEHTGDQPAQILNLGSCVRRAPVGMSLPISGHDDPTLREWTPVVVVRNPRTGEPASGSLPRAQNLLAWGYLRSAFACKGVIEGLVRDTALKDGRPRGLIVDVEGLRAFLPRGRTTTADRGLTDDQTRAVFDSLRGCAIRVRVHQLDLSKSEIILTQSGWETGASSVPLIELDEAATNSRFGWVLQDTPEREGARVIFLEPQGVAARGGVQLGDVVAQIGAIPVRSAADVQWAIEQRALERPTQVHVRRATHTRELRLMFPARQPERGTRPALVAVVGAADDDDFTNVQEALDAMPAGASIRVRPGHYAEPIHMSRPVSLIADAATAEVVLASDAVCIESTADVTLEDCVLASSKQPATRLRRSRASQLRDWAFARGPAQPGASYRLSDQRRTTVRAWGRPAVDGPCVPITRGSCSRRRGHDVGRRAYR